MLVGQKIGPFTVDKELGAGAMGAVYRARHAETGQRVAIKIIAPGLGGNETVMKRFQREAAILKQLRHPNIVRLVATGKFSGTPFYAMEYVEGESLDRVMARRDRLSWEEIVTLGNQLCDALKHAHDKGIVHRDLKPSNIMVLPDGTVKLTDFGIAKDLDVTALTSANCTVGTASYMSPEQCKGERNLTFKSDLYSLGIMFYELLTGDKPFKAESPMDMFLQHVQGTFERPRRLVLDIPVWLDNLVCQLLEKKPEQRPRDASIVAEALNRIKEKVEAQQSAGLDAAKARAGEGPKLDEEDRDAARTLLGKKKKKKKARPFYQKRWFKGVVYSAMLVGIVLVFWLAFIKKPSAEALYQHAEKTMKNGSLDDKIAARKDGALAEFLKYHPTHEKAPKVRAWADEVDREKCETDLVYRFRTGKDFNPDGEEIQGQKAIKAEDEGKLAEARKIWKMLKPNESQKDPEKRAYGLVAQERLKRLAEVDAVEKQLLKYTGSKGISADFKAANDLEKEAIEALQLEIFGGAAKAPEAWKSWKKLKDDLDEARDDLAKRPFLLLAAKHVRELNQRLPAPPNPAPEAEKRKGAQP